MTRTIQKPRDICQDARRAFLDHAAEMYGILLSPDELDDLAALDDRAAVATAFPHLDDAGRHEALWALGRWS